MLNESGSDYDVMQAVSGLVQLYLDMILKIHGIVSTVKINDPLAFMQSMAEQSKTDLNEE